MTHRVDYAVPEAFEPATLHVSTAYATCVHLCACACGCGVEIVTLHPTIGNARLQCRSLYCLRLWRVVWMSGPDGGVACRNERRKLFPPFAMRLRRVLRSSRKVCREWHRGQGDVNEKGSRMKILKDGKRLFGSDVTRFHGGAYAAAPDLPLPEVGDVPRTACGSVTHAPARAGSRPIPEPRRRPFDLGGAFPRPVAGARRSRYACSTMEGEPR